MLTKTRQQVSRVLTGCCVVLWLTGSLSVAQGNLLPQWNMPHCPQGQTQNSQQNHNHCSWHCGGLDIQSSGERGETYTDVLVSRAWCLGVIPLLDATREGEFPPRGPPQAVLRIA
jgi:hypothetical protein